MIINKKTFSILTRSDMPNENWTNDDCYVIEDGSELSNKIIGSYPNIEYIIDKGEIKDVKFIKPEPVEVPISEFEKLRSDIDFVAIMTGVEL